MSAFRKAMSIFVVAAVTLTITGCLTAPPPEESWTKLEIVQATPGAAAEIGNEPFPVTMKGEITFREILTGSVVAEVRWSDTLLDSTFDLDQTDPSLPSAEQIDWILQNSHRAGVATRLVTGFDHLVQTVHLELDASVPPGTAAFLLFYFAEATSDVEVEPGVDSLVIDPYLTTERAILASGIQWGRSI